MKLEEQVCSLDLAKRLKELGVKQESLFWWQEAEPYMKAGEEIMRKLSNPFLHCIDYNNRWSLSGFQTYCFSAFTVAELGGLLPVNFTGIKDAHTFTVRWFTDTNPLRDGKPNSFYESADTEADARAKMLIYLLENKLIAPSAT